MEHKIQLSRPDFDVSCCTHVITVLLMANRQYNCCSSSKVNCYTSFM